MDVPTVNETRKQLFDLTRDGMPAYLRVHDSDAKVGLVDASIDTAYDELEHDILINFSIKSTEDTVQLLQVWANDFADGIWVPELGPGVAIVNEFGADQKITNFHGALIDSKWRKDDAGAKYTACVWGWLQYDGSIHKFASVCKEFTYPR